MSRHIFILFFILSSLPVSAQIGGNSVYKFLNLSVSAKQSALGGKVFTGLKGDIFQGAFNPATIDSTLNNKLGVNYVSYLSDIHYGNIAYARKFNKIGTLYTAVSYVNYGSFQYADESGERHGSFGASESALIIGYSYVIPQSKWAIGINGKYIFSALETYRSSGIALDLGIRYNNREQGVESALVFRNFGTQLSTYQNTKEPLPFEIDFSFSKTFLHAPFKWFVTIENLQKPDIAFINTAHNTQDPNGETIEENLSISDHIFRHLILGVELFPRKRFNLRAGYSFRRAAELSLKEQGFGAGFNFGFGLRMRKFEINYAYGNYNYASNASFISIVVNLNEF